MDIGTLRGLGTLLIMVAFIGLVIWAYSGKRKKSFDEATMLPFADDPEAKKHVEQASRSNKEWPPSGVCTSQLLPSVP
ncbi:TPA: cbb3-type cytochrome c oxidase subunit 3 [Pseudomonas aeruginosa]|nr:cbb3-type cytochrome c oxidase subunit 3 [Pseudomonas aeruginosa]HCR1376619.1 cbb3-type cytochrome c oxidase subunit 3 [Pseudomonas aeruginosa]HCR1583969.1 cbb3-type cytochrome c oxidase subunit 3 [Pseudomonas aeruginosa]